jgi:CubicO group peptidase (beta-lactamase class C family)
VNSFPPAGNIWTNVEEMARLVSLQFRTGPAGGSQILACRSLQEMWVHVAPTRGSGSVGIGWFIGSFGTPFRVLSKSGGSAAWASLVRFVPARRLGVIAFANTGQGVAGQLADVEDLVISTFGPLLPSNPPVCAP